MFRRTVVIAACALLALAPNAYAGREHKWNDNDNAGQQQPQRVNDGQGQQTAVLGGGIKAYGTFSARDCAVRQAQNVASCQKEFNGGYTITFKTPIGSDTYVVVGNYTFAEGGGTVVNVQSRSSDRMMLRTTNVDTTSVTYSGDVMFAVLSN